MKGRLLELMAVLSLFMVLTGCAGMGSATGLELVQGASPVYPEHAREQGIEGSVTLIYNVAADGRVTEVEVHSAEPEGVFEEAALEAVRSWRYRAPPGGDPLENVGSTLEFRLGEAYPDAAPPAEPVPAPASGSPVAP